MAFDKILNDDALLRLRDSHLRRLSDLFSGRHGRNVFVLCGINGRGGSDAYVEPEQWVTEALDDLASKSEALRDDAVFRPLSVNPWPYGVHFVDTLFGARVYELDGEKGNWQADYLVQPVGRLACPDMDAHPAVNLARRFAKTFIGAGVSVPFFAPPVLSSPLNIALNLFGQEFLLSILREPDAARHDLRVITDAIKRLHMWYQEHVAFPQLQMIETCGRIQPAGHGQICGCSTQLVSPSQYAEFVAPLDCEIFSMYPGGGMIHLCGAHAHHIPVWRNMRSLRAVQLNNRAAEDTALYFAGLRADQVLYVNPCATMPVSRILQITGGERTVIVGDIKEPLYCQSPLRNIPAQ